MKIIDNLFLLARFTVLMGLLIVSRLVSPNLTDSALSEREYAEDDPSDASEAPAVYAAVQPRPGTNAGRFDRRCQSHRHVALQQNLLLSSGTGND